MANIRCCGIVTVGGLCALYGCPCPVYAGMRAAHRFWIVWALAAVVIVIAGGVAGLYWGG